VLVLVGAILIGKYIFSGDGVANDKVPVPNLVGQTEPDARKLLTNSDLKIGTVTPKPCEDQSKGKICSQDPEPKTNVEKNSTVNLVVSTGAPKETVPDVTGLTFDKAKANLEDKGFQVEKKTEESDRTPGVVISQTPKGDTEQEKGSTITLTVATERKQVTVPDVTNKTCDEAKAQMTANNLVGECTEVETEDGNLVGKVIQTSPAANTQADPGSKVSIQIGKAAEQQQVTVPTVTQLTLKDAKKALQDAGLAVGQVQGSGNDQAIVFQQNPQPNSQVPAGTAVNLVALDQGGNNGGNNNGGQFFGGTTGTAPRTED
jgi:eukaryotic-like serine/threonine-protein kinase